MFKCKKKVILTNNVSHILKNILVSNTLSATFRDNSQLNTWAIGIEPHGD